ncbi:MAG: hypothetical protein O3B01_11870 [Planctomycetota bacterium]|nr:hypothetical protein [Planctomycetota bacterium]
MDTCLTDPGYPISSATQSARAAQLHPRTGHLHHRSDATPGGSGFRIVATEIDALVLDVFGSCVGERHHNTATCCARKPGTPIKDV